MRATKRSVLKPRDLWVAGQNWERRAYAKARKRGQLDPALRLLKGGLSRKVMRPLMTESVLSRFRLKLFPKADSFEAEP